MGRIAVGVALATLLLGATGAQAGQQPLFEFGTKNGTRLPFRATIAPTGVVAVSGSARTLGPVTLTKPARDGLLRLARVGGFFALPTQIRCPDQPGGLVTVYVHIHTAKLDKTVYEYGGCKPAFDELFALLKAAAAIE
jgi:hypothetical protein